MEGCCWCHKDTAQGTQSPGHFLPFAVSLWHKSAYNRFSMCSLHGSQLSCHNNTLKGTKSLDKGTFYLPWGVWEWTTLNSLRRRLSGVYNPVYINCSRSQETVCIFIWPDGRQGESMLDYVYNIVFFLLTYLLPMVVMAACYSQMGYFLSKYERERQTRMIISTSASTRIRKNKKKVTCSAAEWSTLIGRDPPDTLFWLFELYSAGAKVYAITTHLKAFCAFRCVVMAW